MTTEISQIKQSHVEREWFTAPPLTLKTRLVEDGLEISWDWGLNVGSNTRLLGFRSEGGFTGNDYGENEGVRIVDSHKWCDKIIDYVEPGRTYYYKFILKRAFWKVFCDLFSLDPPLKWWGPFKFSIRLPSRLQVRDPLVSTEETFKTVAKVHHAGAEATRAQTELIRAQTEFEQERRALEEVRKGEEESSNEDRAKDDMLVRMQEAMDNRHKIEEWYKAELDRINKGKYGEDQAQRLRSHLMKLMQEQPPRTTFLRRHH